MNSSEKVSYRRYQRSLLQRKYFDDETKFQRTAYPKDPIITKSVSFNEEVMKIPKSETPESTSDASIATTTAMNGNSTGNPSTEAAVTPSTTEQKTLTNVKARVENESRGLTNIKTRSENESRNLTNIKAKGENESKSLANAKARAENESKSLANVKARAEATLLRMGTQLTRSSAISDQTVGKYTNWGTHHAILAEQPWCCISDLMAFCDKYEFTTISLHDTRTHNTIVAEVTALLKTDTAPFDMRRRFPANIRDPENLWVCIGRCASVEYHLKRILTLFRKQLDKLLPDKQRAVRQNFHLAVNELRLDISARISEVRLYDRNIFESDFNLKWQDGVTD